MSSPFTDFLPGRWLRTRPLAAGVYAVRYGMKDVIVTCFDPAPEPMRAEPAVDFGTAMSDPEYFYAPNDEPGHPTRADDPARYAEARAKGWRPASN